MAWHNYADLQAVGRRVTKLADQIEQAIDPEHLEPNQQSYDEITLALFTVFARRMRHSSPQDMVAFKRIMKTVQTSRADDGLSVERLVTLS